MYVYAAKNGVMQRNIFRNGTSYQRYLRAYLVIHVNAAEYSRKCLLY